MTKIRFENSPSTNTPINAENLNKLNNVVISPTEPTTGEEVWIQKSKNLFNINGNVNLWCNNGVQVSGGNIVSGNVLTATSNTYYSHNIGQKITTLKGKTFTVSAKVVSVGTGRSGYIAIYENNTIVKDMSLSAGSVGQITYTGNSDNIIIGFATASGENAQFTDIQVELGDTATSYEPFIDNENIYTKNGNGVYEEFNNNQRNILCAYLSTSTTVTTNSDQRAKMPLDKYETIGDKLSFDSSTNGIVIGKGVSQISIRASICYTHETSLGNAAINIFKNGNSLIGKLYSSYGVKRTYANMNIDAPFISVTEGDIIHLAIRSVAQTNYSIPLDYGIGVTNLIVEVLE